MTTLFVSLCIAATVAVISNADRTFWDISNSATQAAAIANDAIQVIASISADASRLTGTPFNDVTFTVASRDQRADGTRIDVEIVQDVIPQSPGALHRRRAGEEKSN